MRAHVGEEEEEEVEEEVDRRITQSWIRADLLDLHDCQIERMRPAHSVCGSVREATGARVHRHVPRAGGGGVMSGVSACDALAWFERVAQTVLLLLLFAQTMSVWFRARWRRERRGRVRSIRHPHGVGSIPAVPHEPVCVVPSCGFMRMDWYGLVWSGMV